MTTFVLVHGSGQNAASWSRVGSLLKARGHTVTAPDLPKQAPTWGLEDYATQIARSVTGPDTVVVAHSFSGAFLPLVPTLCACAKIVFFAAVIPEPGKSVRDQFTEDPSMFHSAWIEAGARWFDKSMERRLAEEFLFHDCDAEALAWALETVEVCDTRHLITQPNPFTKWPSVPAASIVATDDRTLSPEWGRRRSRRELAVEPLEMRTGHCPHMSQPRAFADVLEALAP